MAVSIFLMKQSSFYLFEQALSAGSIEEACLKKQKPFIFCHFMLKTM